jgi:hypothetical protein
MSIVRSNITFSVFIAASLCAAIILTSLLVAGDVAGPRVAMSNLPSHAQSDHR